MFCKVFTQILDSSLADDYEIRLVFEDLLKLADKYGVVDMTPQAIARRTNVPLEIVRRGIAALEQPDPASRTADNDGRRIIRLDTHREWGWQIVNWIKYRESATREMLRMGEAERKKAYREKFPQRPEKQSPPVPPLPKSTDTEREAEQSRTCPGHVPDMHVPSLSEFVKKCASLLVPEWYATDKFYAQDSKGWNSGRWESHAMRVKGWFENDGRPMTPQSKNGKNKPGDKI